MFNCLIEPSIEKMHNLLGLDDIMDVNNSRSVATIKNKYTALLSEWIHKRVGEEYRGDPFP